MQCIGIKSDGNQCSVLCVGDHTRCKIHKKKEELWGPNTVRRFEMKYINKKNNRYIQRNYRNDRDEYDFLLRQEQIRHLTSVNELELKIQEETQKLGYDADFEAIERRRQRRLILFQERQQRRQQLLQQHIERRNLRLLEQFVEDKQNVHTSIVVHNVTSLVKKILEIPVPPEYQTDTLKTPGEIILECKLSKNAAWQMMVKYCEEVDIYELGIGIYSKVLNSVWQFIIQSDDKINLYKILATEMEDNIGLCHQGNLSRLCNILSGYIVIEQKASIQEKLAEIRHDPNRIEKAKDILKEYNIPENEWDVWLSPFEDFDFMESDIDIEAE
jgi:hypothetical protein